MRNRILLILGLLCSTVLWGQVGVFPAPTSSGGGSSLPAGSVVSTAITSPKPTVTNSGSTGAETWGYSCIAWTSVGPAPQGTETQIVNGVASGAGLNNSVTCPATSGSIRCDINITTTGAGGSDGAISTGAACGVTFHDTTGKGLNGNPFNSMDDASAGLLLNGALTVTGPTRVNASNAVSSTWQFWVGDPENMFDARLGQSSDLQEAFSAITYAGDVENIAALFYLGVAADFNGGNAMTIDNFTNSTMESANGGLSGFGPTGQWVNVGNQNTGLLHWAADFTGDVKTINGPNADAGDIVNGFGFDFYGCFNGATTGKIENCYAFYDADQFGADDSPPTTLRASYATDLNAYSMSSPPAYGFLSRGTAPNSLSSGAILGAVNLATFAALAPASGTVAFVTDAQVTTVTANVVSNSTCKGSGTGALVIVNGSTLKCVYLP